MCYSYDMTPFSVHFWSCSEDSCSELIAINPFKSDSTAVTILVAEEVLP